MARLPGISYLQRAQLTFLRTGVGRWWSLNLQVPVDRVLMGLTGNRVSLFYGAPVGMLETTGARSGRARRNAVLYGRDGDRVLLVASNAGSTWHPAWFHNLRASPDVVFSGRSGNRRRYRARILEGDERDEVWRAFARRLPLFDDYARRAQGRVIPVVALEPAEDR